jgi:predicted nucleic acid-binding protein
MSTSVVLEAIASAGGLGGVYAVWDGFRKSRAAKKKGVSLGEQIIVQSAVTLLEPLQKQLAETQQQLAEAKRDLSEAQNQIRELGAEVEHQRHIVNETTVKLETANRRADYWQKAFEARAEQ